MENVKVVYEEKRPPPSIMSVVRLGFEAENYVNLAIREERATSSGLETQRVRGVNRRKKSPKRVEPEIDSMDEEEHESKRHAPTDVNVNLLQSDGDTAVVTPTHLNKKQRIAEKKRSHTGVE